MFPSHDRNGQKALREYVLSFEHELLMEAPSHLNGAKRPIVLIHGKNKITKQTIDADKRNTPDVDVVVENNHKNKSIVIDHKRTYEDREFIHGMNLWNFKLLNGNYPENIDKKVRHALIDIPTFHDDLRPWNFIIDGSDCHAIDYNDKTWRKTPEKDGLKKCLKLLNMKPDYSNKQFTELFRTNG